MDKTRVSRAQEILQKEKKSAQRISWKAVKGGECYKTEKKDLARITEDKKLVKPKKASRGAKEPRKIEFFSGGEK